MKYFVQINTKLSGSPGTWLSVNLEAKAEFDWTTHAAVNHVVCTQWNVLLFVHDAPLSVTEKAPCFSCDSNDRLERGPAELHPEGTVPPHKYSEQGTVGDL